MPNSSLRSIVFSLVFLGSPAVAELTTVNTALSEGRAAEAVELLKPLAAEGNVEAQYRLGVMYSIGHGTEVDSALAVQWLEKAAEAGWRPAAIDLGNMYLSGLGVPPDAARARHWMDRAAELAEEQGIDDDC